MFETQCSLKDCNHIIIYCCDGVRLCLCETAVSNGPIVHPPDDILVNMEQQQNGGQYTLLQRGFV
jgi:hypothetical protein